MEPAYMTCIHMDEGLCSHCQADYDYDPQSWIEYGYHRQGEANWRELQKEIAAEPGIHRRP
jgi:hypothetical protein